MGSDGEKAIQITVEGRVQGVFFRAWTLDQAKMLGLRGWVRNCSDGTVEAVFAGPDQQVMYMLSLCWQGPPLARVEGLDYFEIDGAEVAEGFEKRGTV